MNITIRLTLSLSFLICLNNNAFTQGLRFGFDWGIGSMKMTELKDFDYFASQYNHLGPELIDNYPPYYYYKASLSIPYKQFDFGYAFTYHSSGARYSIKDFSGEYLYDSRIQSNSSALFTEGVINPHQRFQFSWRGEFGIISSKLNLKEQMVIGEDEIENESYHFKSTHAYMEPGLVAGYGLGMWKLGFRVAYFIQLGKKGLESKENPGSYLRMYGYKDSINPNWNGYRIGLFATYLLSSDPE